MTTVVSDFERLKTEYESCPNFYEIYAELKDGITRKVNGFVLHDGCLFLDYKLCIIRTSLRKFLIWELHAGGLGRHFENEKTIEVVMYRFYWPSLKYDVTKHFGRCYICQLVKQR